eukprot:1041473-Pyramimonas_sp.AAC.1
MEPCVFGEATCTAESTNPDGETLASTIGAPASIEGVKITADTTVTCNGNVSGGTSHSPSERLESRETAKETLEL